VELPALPNHNRATTGTAVGTEQINSQVSFSGSANDSYSGSNNGSYATNYGGATGSGLGTTTYSGHDSVVYSGTQSISYQVQGNQTLRVYEAGSYANGSYNLGSVVLTKNANTTYTYQYLGVESASGSRAASAAWADVLLPLPGFAGRGMG